MKHFIGCWFLLSTLLIPAFVDGATITARMSGSTIYIEASELSDVAGMDLQFSFLPTKFRVSSVAIGTLFSDGLLAPNFQRAGHVRIGIIQAYPVSGSGTVATIYGDQQGEGSIGMHSFRATGVTTEGQNISLQTRIVNLEGIDQQDIEELSSNEEGRSNKDFVSEEAADRFKAAKLAKSSRAGEEGFAGSGSETRGQNSSAHQAGQLRETSTSATAKMYMFDSDLYQDGKYREGVLSQFASYKGEQSAEELLKMFPLWIGKSIPQEPSIKISNDDKPLCVKVPGLNKDIKGIAIQGGDIISQKSIVDKGLELKILPELNSSMVKVIIFDDSKVIAFPLTVVAFVETDLNGDKIVDRKDLDLYLAKRYLPGYDFDLSGETDYLDEYLYIMNYLVRESPGNIN